MALDHEHFAETDAIAPKGGDLQSVTSLCHDRFAVDTRGEMGLGSILVENRIVIALANFGAIIGLLILCIAGGRKAWAFGKAIWTTNIQAALAASREYRDLQVKACSLDTNMYLSKLTRGALQIFVHAIIATLALIGSMSVSENPQTKYEQLILKANSFLFGMFVALLALSVWELWRFAGRVYVWRLNALTDGPDPD